ncbi:hypothetical protein [Puniceibacterium sp. IMCC21224]|uniref:hypothetical protein n=1 Tax=Puniceibacterium sp. IMCC21224 TaxID=1618204 RepID=UPI00064D9518|nr:hypothetical protein [Puniceibacterium sp. IMCC21224]KMK67630.1 hypothetical protein IMCC21224_112502 [Puniceibacterium sp. IMCC21224]
MLMYLLVKSAGVGVGVFVGTLIGMSIRRRSGKTEGLLNGSVFLTALAAGGLALLAMMVFTYVRGG